MLHSLKSKVFQFLLDRRGSNMGEYAVIGALVLAVAVGAFQLLGVNIMQKVTEIAGAI